jgi:hypothetical protein
MIEGSEGRHLLDVSPTLMDILMANLNTSFHAPSLSETIFLSLTSIIYDPNSINGPQEFNIFPELNSTGIEFDTIVFQFYSDLGSSSTTVCCIGLYGMVKL